MRVPSHPTLVRRMLDRPTPAIGSHGPPPGGQPDPGDKRCGQPSCRCHHGGPLHQAHHLTFSQDGKTHTVYVPQDLVEEVRTWVQESQRFKALIHEVSQLTVALIRGHVRHQKRRRGRR